jgi:hypothetical protein
MKIGTNSSGLSKLASFKRYDTGSDFKLSHHLMIVSAARRG